MFAHQNRYGVIRVAQAGMMQQIGEAEAQGNDDNQDEPNSAFTESGSKARSLCPDEEEEFDKRCTTQANKGNHITYGNRLQMKKTVFEP